MTNVKEVLVFCLAKCREDRIHWRVVAFGGQEVFACVGCGNQRTISEADAKTPEARAAMDGAKHSTLRKWRDEDRAAEKMIRADRRNKEIPMPKPNGLLAEAVNAAMKERDEKFVDLESRFEKLKSSLPDLVREILGIGGESHKPHRGRCKQCPPKAPAGA